MHIAICDDNVADRKQLERLLDRESDKRKAMTGVFYTDSFGMGSQLFPKRMSYDLFFIDIIDDNETGLDFALNLCADGVSAPIALCSSKINYEDISAELDFLPDNIFFINKPILKADLSDLLDKAVFLESQKIPTIELRHQNETYYVKEDDLVYIKEDGLYIKVYLKDGTEVPILDSLVNFGSTLEGFTHFVAISTKVIVNATYVAKYSPFKTTLKSGLKFPTSLIGYHTLKSKMIELNL